MLFESYACQIKGGINYYVPLKKKYIKDRNSEEKKHWVKKYS